MILNQLQLTHFKSYDSAEFEFQSGINCLVGNNGVGKTNLLDAVYYLAFAKTSSNTTDAQNIHFEDSFFTTYGKFDSELVVACQYEKRKGKTLKVNGEEEKKISNHIGRIPLILTTPDDTDIIREGSEYRRKFFDGAIAQMDAEFLKNLLSYSHFLKQRNQHLKQSSSGGINHQLLDTYDASLIPLAIQISQRRLEFLDEYFPHFNENHLSLHQTEESPSIQLVAASLNADFENQFRQSRDKDILLERTTQGSHRDQYEFLLNNEALKKFGSQGQQKTFILALKLAEYDMIQKSKDQAPLLLLDDIFDKLDDERIAALVSILSDRERSTQIFITDARKERSREFFKDQKVNFIDIS